jgi:hypothetical protein
MIGTITQYGIFTLLGAAIILLLSFVVENGIKQVDDMLVPCQHGTPFIQGKCRCDGSPFNGTFCSNCMCEYGSCSLEPTTPFPENDFGCRCPTQMKRFGYFCDLCNTIDANESCKGDCKPDFFGPKCERICYANLDFTNDNSVCNLMRSNGGHCSTCHGHGTCEDGFCECDDNYFNDGRDECVKTCPVSANGQICSGHGNCKLFGNTPACVCEDGWNGITCNIPCPGIEEAGLSCFGHGICNVDFDAETATCDCNQKFRGLDCSIECPGEVVACNGHGTCDDVGMCICQTNVQWSVPSCKCSDELTCNGRGTCTAGEFCACFGNFAGEHCLECKKNWHGEECDLYCDPYLKVNVSDKLENQWGCFGHGTCLERSGKMECTCNLDTTITLNLGGAINDYNSYYDPEMNCGECLSEYFPKQKIVNDHGLPSDYTVPCEGSCNPATCNNRGTCNHNYGIPGENLCACDIPHLSDESFCTSCEENWYPLDFSRDNFCNKFCIASGELPSECDGTIDCVQCNGHGTCSDDAECLCTDGYSGDRCQIYCASDNGVVCGGHGTCESNEIQQLMEHEFEKEGGIATYSCTCDPQDPVDADSRIDWDEKLAQGLVNGTLDPPPDPEFFGETCDYSCVKPPWEASDECNGLGNCSVVTIRDPTDLHIPCFKDSDCTDSTTITQIISGDATWSNIKGPFCHKTDDILGCDKSTDDCYEILLHHRPRKMRSEDCVIGDGFTEVSSGPSIESPFKEVITGPNDNVITEQECDDYAMAAGLYFSTQNSGTRPTGCWLYDTPSPHQIYYNTAPTGGDCSSLQPCLQKRTRVEVTVGPPDLSLSQVECEAYGRDTSGLSWYFELDQSYRPKGCIRINVNQIYYNTGTSSTVECDTTNNAHVSCVQKYDASVYVSKTECQEYAGSNWDVDSFSHAERPSGCFLHTSGTYYYNSQITTVECSSTRPCIQKTSCFDALESLDWHNYCENVMEKEQPDLFSSCKSVASLCKPLKYAPGDMYAEDSGAPDLSLTRKECLDYATSIDSVGATFETTTNGYPSGCIKQIVGGANFNKINYNTGTGDCSHVNVNCIQKRDICMPMVHMTDGIDVSYKLNLTYEYDKRQYPFLISNEYRTTMGALEHDEAEAFFSNFAHDVDMKLPTDFCSKHKTRYPEFNSVRENKQYLCNGLIVDTKTCDGVLSESANNFYNPFTVECPNSVETFSTYQDAVLNREYGCKIVETQKDHVFIDNKEEMGRLHVDSVCDHITNKFPSCKYPSPCDFNPCLDGYGCANSGTKAICSTTGNINSTCLKGTMERISYTSYSCDIVVPDTTCPIDNTFSTNVAQHCIDNNPIVSHVETIGENENKALTGAKYIHFEFKAEDLVSTSTRLEFLSGTTDVVTIYVRQGQIQLNEVELLQACPLTNQQCNDAWAYEPDIWYHIELELSAPTEVTSGQPTSPLSQTECEEYANSIGASYAQNVNNPGPGCVKTADSAHVRYNPGACQHASACDCSSSNICVEKPTTVKMTRKDTGVSLERDLLSQNTITNVETVSGSGIATYRRIISETDIPSPYSCTYETCDLDVSYREICSDIIRNVEYPSLVLSVKEVDSGAPDMSLSEDECRSYAESIGAIYTTNTAWGPSGCIKKTNYMYYITDTTSHDCGHISWNCIQKPTVLDTCSTLYENTRLPRDESSYYEQTSGQSDLSVSQSECEEYLTKITATSMSLINNPSAPNGCYIAASGALLYYNSNGGNCETGRPCIQKKSTIYDSFIITDEAYGLNWEKYCDFYDALQPANVLTPTPVDTGKPELSWIPVEVASGAVAESPYYEQTSGAPDLSVSQSECEEYVTSIGETMTNSNLNAGFRPSGCLTMAAGYFFNHATTTHECDDSGGSNSGTCIQKTPSAYVSESQCKEHADQNGYIWATHTQPYRPAGCWLMSASPTSYIYWNYATDEKTCDTGPCIQSAGDNPAYMTESECEEYRGSGWSSDTYSTDRPTGCYVSGGAIYFNHEETNVDCSAYTCIKKLPQPLSLSDFGKKVTTGTNENSISQAACEAYAQQEDISFTASPFSSTGVCGCFHFIGGNTVYYNTNTDCSGSCSDNNQCLQQKTYENLERYPECIDFVDPLDGSKQCIEDALAYDWTTSCAALNDAKIPQTLKDSCPNTCYNHLLDVEDDFCSDRAEIFTSNTDVIDTCDTDWYNYCLDDAKGTLEGKCSAVECTCDYESYEGISGEACQLHCPLAFDGSACAEVSGMGKCVYTPAQKTFMANGGIFDPVWAIEGECQCFIGEGTRNCDIECRGCNNGTYADRYITSGIGQSDDDITEEACKEYAESAVTNTNLLQSYGNNRPSGCFRDIPNNYVYFNTDVSSTACSNNYPCVVKNPNAGQIGICDNGRGVCDCLPPFTSIDTYTTHDWRGKDISVVERSYGDGGATGSELYRIRQMQGKESFVKNMLQEISINNEITFTATTNHYVYNGQNDPDINVCRGVQYKINVPNGHDMRIIPEANCQNKGCNEGEWLELPVGERDLQLNDAHVFLSDGLYFYVCKNHPKMVGKFIVTTCSGTPAYDGTKDWKETYNEFLDYPERFWCYDKTCSATDVAMLGNLAGSSSRYNFDCNKQCLGFDPVTQLSCNGNGYCGAIGECICDKAKILKNVPDPPVQKYQVIPGIEITDTKYEPSSLERTGFRGEACDTICPGYDPLIGDMNSICNGHGVCDLSGMCACDLGYTGDECQFTCPVDEGNICNGHGTCEMAEVRVQLDIYDGFDSSCTHFADVDNCNAYAVLNDLELVNIAHTKVVGENAACKRISEAECEAWGNFQEVTYTYEGTQDSSGNPTGCYFTRENKIFFNTGGQTDNCGSNNKLCICETEIPDVVYCSLDNNKVVIHTKGGKPYTNKKGLYDMEGVGFYEQMSGVPQFILTEAECIEYADSTYGRTFKYGGTWNAPTPTGCWLLGTDEVYYNRQSGAGVCSQDTCIQKTALSYNDAIIKCDADNCLAIQQNPPASDDYYVLDESKFVRDVFNEGFSPAESCENPRLLGEIPNVVGDEVALKTCLGFCRSANTGSISDSDTGAPNDGSVSRTECEEWAAAQNLWQSQVSWSTYPTGCIRHSNGYFYYNTGGSANCGVYTTKCAQKSACTTFSLRPGSYAASCFKCDPASDSDAVTKRRYKKRRDGNAEFAIKQTGDADHSVSQSQCEQYAADQGVTVTVSSWSTFHYGCSKYYNTKNYYWNTYGINSNIQCGVANHYCVQLSGQTLMTEEECDDIASLGSGEYEKDTYDDLPKGCLIEGNTIKFNYRSEGKNTAYTANVMGVVKLPNAISTFILTTFGAPNLSLNEAECRKLGSIDGRWIGTDDSTLYPKGCVRQNSNDVILYAPLGTVTCTTTYACLEVGAFETYYGPDGNDGSVDELQCEHYAETFAPGMTFSAGSWSSDPAGCYHTLSTGTVYFNRQATGRACNTNSNYECIRISPYTKEEFQVVNSGLNTNSVAKSECKSFGLRNGFTSFSSVYDNGNYPSYCSVTDGLNIYWNSYTTSSKFCDFSFGCIQDVVSSAYNVDELISGEDYTRYIRNPNSLCIKESALDVESRTQAPVIKSLREYNDKCKYFSATDNCPIKATEEQCNRYSNGGLFNGFEVITTNEGFPSPPPYEKITAGTPDLSLSQSECEMYATDLGLSFSLYATTSELPGCWENTAQSNVYFTTIEVPSGKSCSASARACIQKRKYFIKNAGQPNESVSRSECQQFASTIIGGAFANSDEIGNPKGCFAQNSAIYYNTNTASTKECGAYGISDCVERYTLEIANKYISKVECAALPDYHTVSTVAGYPYGCIYQTVGGTAQYKYQFNTNIDATGNCDHSAQNCAQKKPYSKQLRTDRPDGCYMDGSRYKYNEAVVEVDSGAPDGSLSQTECEEYANSIGASFGTNSQNPGPGCVVTADSAHVRYNPGACQHASLCDCSSSNICIQKGAPIGLPVSDGAPSMSLSQAECQAYATSKGKTMPINDGPTNGPSGCGLYPSSGSIYWSNNGGNCGTNGIVCIEKPCAAFRCVCASDMYMDETTGICKPISGKPIIKATFIQDRNMDEEKSFQVDCQVVSDTKIECAQCSCFGDFMYGYWAGQTCSTCATGYGKSQCSAVCPDFDGETKKSMCAELDSVYLVLKNRD